MNKEELIIELDSIKEKLKESNKLKYSFKDDDDPEKILSNFNRIIHKIHLFLNLNDLKEISHPKNKALREPLFGKIGSLVKVKPCNEEFNNKTYFGFLIGDVATGSSITIDNDKVQLNFSNHNPAIFIPELKKVIYGYESWWSVIKNEEELKDITNDDILNTWYVKLLKELG